MASLQQRSVHLLLHWSLFKDSGHGPNANDLKLSEMTIASTASTYIAWMVYEVWLYLHGLLLRRYY